MFLKKLASLGKLLLSSKAQENNIKDSYLPPKGSGFGGENVLAETHLWSRFFVLSYASPKKGLPSDLPIEIILMDDELVALTLQNHFEDEEDYATSSAGHLHHCGRCNATSRFQGMDYHPHVMREHKSHLIESSLQELPVAALKAVELEFAERKVSWDLYRQNMIVQVLPSKHSRSFKRRLDVWCKNHESLAGVVNTRFADEL